LAGGLKDEALLARVEKLKHWPPHRAGEANGRHKSIRISCMPNEPGGGWFADGLKPEFLLDPPPYVHQHLEAPESATGE